MKKTLRLMLLSLIALTTGTAMAETVTIDFDNDYQTLFPTITGVSSGTGASYVADGEFHETTTSTAVGGVTVTVAPADDATTPDRIWASSPRLRLYSGTFTVTGTDITKIEFDAHSTNFNIATEQGTLDNRTWTGDKTYEVVFSVSRNTQIKKITVTLGEGGEVTPPNPPAPEVQLVTVAEALAIIDALPETGGKTDVEYQVKGFVVSVSEINTQYGNATFTMADAKGGSPVLTYFRGKGFNGASITDTELVKVDDEVVVQGLLQKYVKNETVTPEVAQGGQIISINGNTGDETPVTVEKAANIAAFKAIESGKTVELTLTNAVVTYVNNFNGAKELFIRDASGAADLYDLGINAEAGQVLNGTIIGSRSARSGFTIAMAKSNNTDANTVTVSGTAGEVEAIEFSVDEAADYYCNYVVLKGVAISEDGKAITDDGDMALYDRFQLKLTSELLKDGTKYDIYGLMYDGGVQYGAELVVTKVTLAGGGEIVEDPATPVESIAALLALESPSSNLELTLTNAKVVFNDGNYIYVRENGAALCFYQISGLKDVAKNNAVINGKIDVDYEVYRLLPEVKGNKNTKLDGLVIEESEEAAQPVETTLADVAAGNNVCDLVTLTATLVREVAYKDDGVTVSSTTYFLQDGETKLVVVNNSKNLKALADEGVETIVVTGIVNTSNNAYQIKLTKNAENVNASSISSISTEIGQSTIYNLAGQRVVKAQKGISIVGGKKLIVK